MLSPKPSRTAANEALQKFSTPRDLLRYAVTRFNESGLYFGHGSANAYDEAAFLILHTLSLPVDKLEPFLDAKLLHHEILHVMAQIDRRITERIPAAYLTCEAWLQGYSFYVDSRVLIPRSFLAELIVEQFAPWIADPGRVTDILELCTGSGCLAILLADAFPNAKIDATDISADALAVARQNVENYHMKDRITLIESDLYDALPEKPYDLIIANPPYVNSESMKNLPPEYRHEPQLALAGGTDGMDMVRVIIHHASRYLKKSGVIFVEIGNEAKYAEKAFPGLPLGWILTSGGNDRVFMLAKKDLPK